MKTIILRRVSNLLQASCKEGKCSIIEYLD